MPTVTLPLDDSGTSSTTSSPGISSGEAFSSSSGSSSSSSSGARTSDGLVLWYPFDDDPVDVGGAVDAGPNGLDATCAVGECPALDIGPTGTAVVLDGTDDYFDVEDNPAFELTEALTLMLWARLDGGPTPASQVLFGKAYEATGENSYELYLSQGDLRFNMGEGAGTIVSIPSPFADDQWVHLAATWDGGTMSLFIDGEFVASEPNALVPTYPDGHPPTVGADFGGNNVALFFSGGLDEVRLYSRALDEDEIAALAKP